MRYFLLDKQFLMQNPCRARVIAISDKEFTKEEINQAMDRFQTIDTLIHVGEDIPHYIDYDYMSDTIKEKVILPQKEIQGAEVIQEPKKIFDDSVEVQHNVYYFYIDKKIADEQGVSETKATFERPVIDPADYFGIETYMIKGDTVPYYVTVADGFVREATKYERYKRGQYVLEENEEILNNNIVELKSGQFVDGGAIKSKVIPNRLISYTWIFGESEWVRTYSDVYELNKLQDIIASLQNKKLALQSLGFATDAIDKELHLAKETHRILAENVANLINNKGVSKQNN